MHCTPVAWAMIFIITKEDRTSMSPIIPKVKLFLALSIFLASPAEFMSLNPPKINIIRAISPANARRALRIFKKIVGIQLNVATSPPGLKQLLGHNLPILRE